MTAPPCKNNGQSDPSSAATFAICSGFSGFPANALRGEISFGQPPEVLLNGEPARLAPASRIRGTNNLLVMSGALIGKKAIVHYTLDPLGLVQDVWILTDAERGKQPWPTKAAEARTWSFDPVAQVWTKRWDGRPPP